MASLLSFCFLYLIYNLYLDFLKNFKNIEVMKVQYFEYLKAIHPCAQALTDLSQLSTKVLLFEKPFH